MPFLAVLGVAPIVLPFHPAESAAAVDDQTLGPEKRAEKLLLLPYWDPARAAVVVDALLKGLTDPAAVVRMSAAYGLANVPAAPASNEALISALQDRDLGVRGAAAYAVGVRHLSSATLAAALRENLRQQDGAARLYSAFALVATVGKHASGVAPETFTIAAVGGLPAMFDALRERSALSSARIARALVVVDEQVARNLLPALASLRLSDVASLAGNAMAAGRELGAGRPELVRDPLHILAAGDKDARLEAARELGLLRVSTPPVVEALGSCLASSHEADEIRVECTRAVGLLGSKATRESPRLIALLHGQNPTLRSAALQALYSTNKKMLEGELPALERSNPELAKEANGLIRLGELQEFGP